MAARTIFHGPKPVGAIEVLLYFNKYKNYAYCVYPRYSGISVELSMKSFYNIRTRTSLVMVKQEGPEDPIAAHLRLAGPFKDHNKSCTPIPKAIGAVQNKKIILCFLSK